ncbi:hypothetical protein [Sandaracinus amylolyticus]|uniref:zinc finger domain-containing protein n=1 Tax=Sandaracinus amylolyticus TaxID=927083 RepID=UPI003AF33A38
MLCPRPRCGAPSGNSCSQIDSSRSRTTRAVVRYRSSRIRLRIFVRAALSSGEPSGPTNSVSPARAASSS